MKLSQLPSFKVERYFAKYEFTAPYLLSCSDSEPLTVKQVLAFADDETKKMWENLTLHYTESQGLPLLRKEITSLYNTITPEQVLVLAPQEGVLLGLNTLVKEGDHVIAQFPGYQSLYDDARVLGADVSFWKPQEKENGWKFVLKDLEMLIKKNTKVLVINFPHNPTGALPTQEEFKELLAIAKKHNLTIFSDEMYRGLEYDSKDRLPSVPDVYENAIALSGVSKVYSMPGARIGWLTTKNKDYYVTLCKLKDFTTICSSAPSEILALIGLRADKKIREDNIKTIKKNIELCKTFFKKHNDLFVWIDPRGGSIIFPRLISDESPDEFVDRVRENTGVVILPGSVFDWDGNNFRIGLGRKDVPEVLKRVDDYLSKGK